MATIDCKVGGIIHDRYRCVAGKEFDCEDCVLRHQSGICKSVHCRAEFREDKTEVKFIEIKRR